VIFRILIYGSDCNKGYINSHETIELKRGKKRAKTEHSV